MNVLAKLTLGVLHFGPIVFGLSFATAYNNNPGPLVDNTPLFAIFMLGILLGNSVLLGDMVYVYRTDRVQGGKKKAVWIALLFVLNWWLMPVFYCIFFLRRPKGSPTQSSDSTPLSN